MQIDSKSPCSICEKLNKCKTENKNRVRKCDAFKSSEFYEMLGMSIEEKVDSFGETIKFLNKIKADSNFYDGMEMKKDG